MVIDLSLELISFCSPTIILNYRFIHECYLAWHLHFGCCYLLRLSLVFYFPGYGIVSVCTSCQPHIHTHLCACAHTHTHMHAHAHTFPFNNSLGSDIFTLENFSNFYLISLKALIKYYPTSAEPYQDHQPFSISRGP